MWDSRGSEEREREKRRLKAVKSKNRRQSVLLRNNVGVSNIQMVTHEKLVGIQTQSTWDCWMWSDLSAARGLKPSAHRTDSNRWRIHSSDNFGHLFSARGASGCAVSHGQSRSKQTFFFHSTFTALWTLSSSCFVDFRKEAALHRLSDVTSPLCLFFPFLLVYQLALLQVHINACKSPLTPSFWYCWHPLAPETKSINNKWQWTDSTWC